MLLCTVRDCHLPLRREPRRWICERGHAFDVARSGYGNLLQPNDRRSRTPGDSADAVAARRRLEERGTIDVILSEAKDLRLRNRRSLYVEERRRGEAEGSLSLELVAKIGSPPSSPRPKSI